MTFKISQKIAKGKIWKTLELQQAIGDKANCELLFPLNEFVSEARAIQDTRFKKVLKHVKAMSKLHADGLHLQRWEASTTSLKV